MRWVYILKCKNDYYYVGETKRLFRRFWEHFEGLGGLNTSIHIPEKIVAIYRIDTVCKFIEYHEYITNILNEKIKEKYKPFKLNDFVNSYENDTFYDNLYAENIIVETLMLNNRENFSKIRGGKYVRFDVNYTYPHNIFLKYLPLCNCGLPCDIKKNIEKNYLYFRCAKKNMWSEFKEQFDIIDEPCKFFMEYVKDKELREENIQRQNKIKQLFQTSYWLTNIETIDNNQIVKCVGGCSTIKKNDKLTYGGKLRNLCFDCFIDKNKELSEKYKRILQKINNEECLIKLEI